MGRKAAEAQRRVCHRRPPRLPPPPPLQISKFQLPAACTSGASRLGPALGWERTPGPTPAAQLSTRVVGCQRSGGSPTRHPLPSASIRGKERSENRTYIKSSANPTNSGPSRPQRMNKPRTHGRHRRPPVTFSPPPPLTGSIHHLLPAQTVQSRCAS
ncbi:hypothetical protein LZ30DRAFT_412964 [Colletotrichum cereale]|nr:hypothetical protein LZ30DRAFT_412964 [Colletotrichum cereale]